MDTALQDGVVRARGPRYRHDALFFSSPGELAAATVPFVRDGLAAGDAVVVAASPATADLVRTAVDGDERVRMLERGEAYARRTPAAVTAFRRLTDELTAAGAAGVRVVGETDFGRTEREWLEWQRYEAVLNRVLAPWPLWGLCVFDTTRLPEPVLESVARTHPAVVVGRSRTANPHFVDPAEYLRGLPVPPEPLQGSAPRLAVDDVADPIALRHAVAAELASVRGPREVVEDFLLAVDETTSNAIRHGAPPVGLRLWTSADRLVCTVTDAGPGPDDPFAGYGPAHGTDLSRGGMGVWLARQLCDHVDISPGPDGVTVRLTTALR
ncbi:Histidine kinase-like ATPase domain-containing protein [Geodermatophilus africanus]|uniref:Histidine kinase-like ATPase domain-containing protein n=1 Tax=Geodermatophilus africanus TaxID=1137993 RepID=A0A1H3B0L3_9ACTN|nr:sensor histidine kinase [Geodermatophilus africanus]SDX35443.1 Histidine kinase-like ATPase domain-containing protein [Geodermatophilus africanus]